MRGMRDIDPEALFAMRRCESSVDQDAHAGVCTNITRV